MASLSNIFQGGFDPAAVEPDQGRDFSPLPAGTYEAEITNAEVKDAKSGNGCYLSLEFTVIGSDSATGRKVWGNITLKNTNAQAESIGQAQLSALCRAVGIGTLSDSDQLFQKIVRIRLKVTPARDGYQAKNDITGFEAMGGAPTPAAASQRPAANAPTPGRAAPSSPPWARK